MPKGACAGSDFATAPGRMRFDPCRRAGIFGLRALPTRACENHGPIHKPEVAMPTPRKEAMLAEIQDRMERASIAISADYRGLTVAQITELRRALRPAGAEVKVVKNTLAAMAAKAAGRENMAEILQGPTALAIGFDDPIAPVKALTEHLRARRLNIAIHGGWLEGKVLSRAEVESLATMPSKEQMIADVVGKLQSPLYNFAGLLQSTMRNFAGLVDARAKQLEAAG